MDKKSIWSKEICIASVVGGLVIFSLLVISGEDPEPQQKTNAPSSYISYVSINSDKGDTVLEQQAELFDTEPIFLTTQWNSGQSSVPAEARSVETSKALQIPLKIELPSIDIYSQESLSASSLKSSVELIEDEYINPFSHFANNTFEEQEPNKDRPSLFVYKITEPDTPMTYEIKAPEVLQALENYSGTIECLLLIDETGIMGTPYLQRSSGNETLDRTVRGYIRNLQAIKTLPSGYYKVVLGS